MKSKRSVFLMMVVIVCFWLGMGAVILVFAAFVLAVAVPIVVCIALMGTGHLLCNLVQTKPEQHDDRDRQRRGRAD